MELGATGTPVTTLPLPHGGDDVAIVSHLILSPQGELPADLWLPEHEALVVVGRGDVEGAAGSSGESRPVQEHAGIVDEGGRRLAVGVRHDELVRRIVLELPLVAREQGRLGQGVGDVLLVEQVGAVAAAPLDEVAGILGQDALAAGTEDAGPAALEIGEVEAPRPLFVRRVEADPLVRVSGCLGHEGNLASCPTADDDP